jgi:hypothetical protein
MGALIAFFSFFLVVIGLATIYVYNYHGVYIKHFIGKRLNQNIHYKNDNRSNSVNSTDMTSAINTVQEPPKRPPRTKQSSHNNNIRTITPEESEIMSESIINDKNFDANSCYFP